MFSSTAAVYGEPKAIPIIEDADTCPQPYGESKLAVENCLNGQTKQVINYITLRYFNAAGAHESGEIGEVCNQETH